MEKINPSAYITDVDPTDEPIMLASDWYETETKTLTAKGTAVRSGHSQIPWLLAQGWSVTDTTSTSENIKIMLSAPSPTIGGPPPAYISYVLITTIFTLERRTLKAEYALNQLIESFTKAYNEGRTLNDSRYDELVTLYSVMLDKTEDEIIANEDDPDAFKSLIDDIIATMNADYVEVRGDLDGALDDYGDAQRIRVNTQFNNKIIEVRAGLVSRGMLNSTLLDSLTTGIERERAFALTGLEDSVVDRQLSLRGTIYGFKETLNTSILEAQSRLRAQLNSEGTEGTSLRNQVFQSMLSFMERREDGYPDLSAIAGLTNSLGANSSEIQSP